MVVKRLVRNFLLFLSLWLVPWVGGATNLGPGDIAFTSINADGNKRFSFVLTRDIEDSTAIYFTDNGWNATTDTWHNTTEGTLLWYFNGALPCGTEIHIDPSQDTTNIGVVSLAAGAFIVSTVGDAILAYRGPSVGTVTAFISGINIDAGGWTSTPASANDSDIPDELTDGLNAIALFPHQDNWVYDCSATSGFSSVLTERINDAANWNSDDVNEWLAPGCIVGCGDPSSYPLRTGPGFALDFDGTDDAVNAGPGLRLTGAFTFEAWVNPSSDSPMTLASYGLNIGAVNRVAIGIGNGWTGTLTNELITLERVDFAGLSLIVGCTSADRSVLFDGGWHHVVVKYDGLLTYTFLIDGLVYPTTVGSAAGGLTANLPNVPQQGFLGCRNINGTRTFFFEGNLDELRIWNAALPNDTLRAWMCKKLTPQHGEINDLKDYFRFDELSGSAITNLTTGVDASLENFGTQPWVLSGAALGTASVQSYSSTAISLSHGSGDFMSLDNFGVGIDGIHLYLVTGSINYTQFKTATFANTNYHFGVFKVGAVNATYDVTYSYANTAALTSATNEYRVGLASRENHADSTWLSKWFEGTTNTAANTVFLPGQTGTHYAGIVSANNALQFDGINDFVTTNPAVNIDNSFTVDAWISIDDQATQRTIFTTRGAFTVDGWVLSALADERIQFELGTTSGWEVITSPAPIDTAWHHIAAVFDGDSGISLYIDGALVAQRNDVVDYVHDATQPLLIGQLPAGTNRFNGKIDELRIWNRELCESEIQGFGDCELDTVQFGLHTYYSFNQGVAGDTNTGLDSLIDQSGNGNNGTLSNFALLGATSNWISGSYGILGTCVGTGTELLYVLSEGDTIYAGDSVTSVADSTNFGNIPIGLPFTVTYELENAGFDTLFVDSVAFMGPDSAAFSAAFTNVILPGGTGLLSVTVVPTAPGTIATNVVIYSSDCDASPYVFAIEGTVNDRAGALRFDGTNDQVQIPYLPINNISNNWTIEAWVRPATITGGFRPIVAKAQFPNPPSLWLNNQKVHVWMGGATASIISTANLVADQWVHIAATFEEGDLRLYINGVLDNTSTYGGAIPTNNTSYFIGNGEGIYYLRGDLDEVRIWGRARNAVEVAQTMNCELEGTECDLIHYYNFNVPGAYANSVNTGFNVLGDSALNGGNGTLTNFALSGIVSNWVAQQDSVVGDCSAQPDSIPPLVFPFSQVVINLFGLQESVTVAMVDSASCDYYSGIDSMWVFPDSVTCGMDGDLGQLFVLDSAGNLDSASFVFSVIDSAPPGLLTRNVSAYLDGTGTVTVPAAAVDSASFDNCQIFLLWLEDSVFTCADAGPNVVWFFGRDTNGLVDSVQVTITVIDTVLPNVSANNLLLYLDNTGSYTLDTSEINNASSDACGIDSMWISQSLFTCADTGASFTIWFYASDLFGNVDSASSVVIVADTLPPTAVAVNSTVYLDATGVYTLDTSEVNAGSFDNCAVADMWLSQSNFTCADTAAPLNIIFYVEDLSGNVDSAFVTITVVDTLPPLLVATDTTIILDAAGNWTIDTSYIHVSSFDNCAIDSIWLSRYDFTCADATAIQTIQLFARDISGNTTSVNALVTVVDNIPPVVTASNISVYLDGTGSITIDTADLNAGSSDICTIDTMWLSQYTFGCADTSSPVGVWLFAQDPTGNVDSALAQVTVLDTLPPTIVITDTTILLDSSGNFTIDVSFIDAGTFDNCDVDTTWLSQYMFTCLDTGLIQTVTFYARDISGNIDSGVANVTVLDANPPQFVTNDTFIILDATGNFTIDTSFVYSGSLDNCAFDTVWLSRYAFNCTDLAGPQNVTVYARDLSMNLDSQVVVVTVLDTIFPVVTANDIDVFLDPTGSITIDTTDVNAGVFDICLIDTMWLSRYTYGCADTAIVHFEWLYAQDFGGNVDSAQYEVRVYDTLAPVLVTTDTTIYLDVSGAFTIDTTFINVSSSDNCGIDTMWLSQYDFDCDDTVAAVPVTFYARDISGNLDSVIRLVTVVDSLPPVVLVTDTTIWLDATGVWSIDTGYVHVSSSDNCGINSYVLSRTSYDCDDLSAVQSDTLFVTDISGNITAAPYLITVLDTFVPVVSAKDTTIYLDATGSFTIDTTYINDGSFDNCYIDTMWLSQYTFACADTAAPNPVTFYAQDSTGNVDSALVFVTVFDTLPPVLVTTDVTIYLDASGNFTIDTTFINVASSDNCQIDTMWLSRYDFDCSDTSATVPVTFYARDISGNVDSITRIVTIVDSTPPIVVVQDTTIWLDASGSWTIDTGYVFVGSSDNCGLTTFILSRTVYDCDDLSAVQSDTLFVTDSSGNVTAAPYLITVLDTLIPTVNAKDTTIFLDASGSFTIDTTYINDGSFDNCYIDTMWLSQYTFACADTAAPNPVIFYAADSSGNYDSAFVFVTVVDTLTPVLVTTDVTIYLDSTGNFTIDTTFINVASSDNCEIDTMWLSQYDFDCNDTAVANLVTFYARDISGNVDSVTRIVTVVDSTPPIVLVQDTTIWLDATGTWSIDTAYVHVSSSDNCGISSYVLSRTIYDCDDLSAVQSDTLFVTDISGNVTAAPFLITVLDTLIPTVIVTDTTIYLDATGNFTIDTTYINDGSFDNCYIDTMWLSRYDFSCIDTAAPNPVMFYAQDSTGNLDSASVFVTVIDSLAPFFVTTDTTIYLDSTGNLTIDTTFINVASWDNCEIDTMWLSRYDSVAQTPPLASLLPSTPEISVEMLIPLHTS